MEDNCLFCKLAAEATRESAVHIDDKVVPFDDLNPQARIEINPADAARLKIEDGETVRVSSRRGTVVLRAWVTQRTTVGVVFIPMHFHEAAANLLTIDALDPLAKIPEYKACPVRIVPAGKEELPPMITRGRY